MTQGAEIEADNAQRGSKKGELGPREDGMGWYPEQR